MSLAKYIWPAGMNTPTPRIDIWKMSSTEHVFGYWEDGTQASPSCPPSKEVSIAIVDGNYEGNPVEMDIYDWIRGCFDDMSKFTIENYRKEFRC